MQRSSRVVVYSGKVERQRLTEFKRSAFSLGTPGPAMPCARGRGRGEGVYQCLPINAACGGFWKVDIDKMGSDLARRPSEKAPRNCDSSGSEKSNDSSRINGVCNSELNCKTPPGQFSVRRVRRWV